jgi:quinol monooxygenase YgiN
MEHVELYAKFKVRPGLFARYRQLATAIAALSRDRDDGTLRCDWFANEACHEGVALFVHRDATALQAHRALNSDNYAQLSTCCDVSTEFLGTPSDATRRTLAGVNPGVLDFAFGMQAVSGAQAFTRAVANVRCEHIEIYTRFLLQPGRLAEFRQVAAELLAVVKNKDPATSRYDWFFDADGRVSVAMDTYDTASAMFAHMRNCHDVHEKLLHMSTMVAEFLGDLPPDALQAVRKYNPYIASFVAGLKPYSSGGFR